MGNIFSYSDAPSEICVTTCSVYYYTIKIVDFLYTFISQISISKLIYLSATLSDDHTYYPLIINGYSFFFSRLPFLHCQEAFTIFLLSLTPSQCLKFSLQIQFLFTLVLAYIFGISEKGAIIINTGASISIKLSKK